MREFTQDANPNTVETFSRKILLGIFGDGRYIKSLKGGDCIVAGTGELVPAYELHDLPKNIEELTLKIDLAGINLDKCKISLIEQI
jgi:hypothetical protein